MVFESYVVDILNKFLGQYVENLDPSQFQMSIWGGEFNSRDQFYIELKLTVQFQLFIFIWLICRLNPVLLSYRRC